VKRKLQTLIMTLAMMLFGAAPAIVFTGCEEKTPAEKLGDDLKDLGKDVKDAVEDAADDVKDSIK